MTVSLSLSKSSPETPSLSWFAIVRLGLVQTALGAIVILTTSTMNRVMVVELMLPAMLPGILVVLHYAIQMLRPRWGYGSDMGGQRTPWIISGMAILALGGVGAAAAIAVMAVSTSLGIALAVIAFLVIGVGVGASGTSLLVLLATHVKPSRRAAAASIVWTMMIAGFVVTAISVGALLDPYSHERLIAITAGVGAIAFFITLIAVWQIEKPLVSKPADKKAEDERTQEEKPSFPQALREVWQEQQARRFTIFVFVSMLAYSAQDLILEPFAGIVFNYTPGESTALAGTQHAGVLLGMALVALIGSLSKGHKIGSLRLWTVVGCLASALSLFGLSFGAYVGPSWPLQVNVFLLGFSTGAFAVAAIGSMMGLASAGRESREGVRMGLWGAAQAIAFGLGGLLGAASVDLAVSLFDTPVPAYATVFAIEGLLFIVSAFLALYVGRSVKDSIRLPTLAVGENYLADATVRS